jgi:hypothetical protein
VPALAAGALPSNDHIYTGPKPNVIAVGENVTCCGGAQNNQYRSGSGTSYAAAQVCGLAILLKWIKPNISAQRIRQFIQDNADRGGLAPIVPMIPYDGYGFGLINVYATLTALFNHLAAGNPFPEFMELQSTNSAHVLFLRSQLDPHLYHSDGAGNFLKDSRTGKWSIVGGLLTWTFSPAHALAPAGFQQGVGANGGIIWNSFGLQNLHPLQGPAMPALQPCYFQMIRSVRLRQLNSDVQMTVDPENLLSRSSNLSNWQQGYSLAGAAPIGGQGAWINGYSRWESNGPDDGSRLLILRENYYLWVMSRRVRGPDGAWQWQRVPQGVFAAEIIHSLREQSFERWRLSQVRVRPDRFIERPVHVVTAAQLSALRQLTNEAKCSLRLFLEVISGNGFAQALPEYSPRQGLLMPWEPMGDDPAVLRDTFYEMFNDRTIAVHAWKKPALDRCYVVHFQAVFPRNFAKVSSDIWDQAARSLHPDLVRVHEMEFDRDLKVSSCKFSKHGGFLQAEANMVYGKEESPDSCLIYGRSATDLIRHLPDMSDGTPAPVVDLCGWHMRPTLNGHCQVDYFVAARFESWQLISSVMSTTLKIFQAEFQFFQAVKNQQ